MFSARVSLDGCVRRQLRARREGTDRSLYGDFSCLSAGLRAESAGNRAAAIRTGRGRNDGSNGYARRHGNRHHYRTRSASTRVGVVHGVRGASSRGNGFGSGAHGDLHVGGIVQIYRPLLDGDKEAPTYDNHGHDHPDEQHDPEEGSFS